MEEKKHEEAKSFKELGVCDALVEACTALQWIVPTKIQSESIPHALQGKDIIGTAKTGTGKTGAFALPIIQALLEAKIATPFFGLVLVPTRELAIQIAEQFKALGSGISLKTAVLIGGVDMNQQQLALAKRPHIVVATPGRLMDHLTNTKGFSLRALKYLVLDEADNLLNVEFEKSLDDILKEIPRERRTYLFSATMDEKVRKLQRACLRNPVKVGSASNNSTNDTLKQEFCLIPAKYKDCCLLYVLMELSGRSVVFTNQCNTAQVVALMLRNLGLSALPITGKMTQAKRLGALNKFKAGDCNILVASNVLSRGHDMPFDMVINYDIPTKSEDYIHRVGRTARAGRTGVAISLVSQYGAQYFKLIERLIGKEIPLRHVEEEEVLILLEHVTKAKRIAHMKIKESGGRKRKGMVDEETEEIQKYLDRQHSRKSNKRHRRR